MPEQFNYRPRGAYVLISIQTVEKTSGGVAVPQWSIQGKEFIVIAIGPEVKDLNVGDKVLMLGKQDVDFFPLPNSSTLLVIPQGLVVLVLDPIPAVPDDDDFASPRGEGM